MPLIESSLLKTVRPLEGFYTSHVETPSFEASPGPSLWPVRTFLPTGYEPRYPYPLLVFFHGHAGNEEQILTLAPRLSRRNFIAIGLRGPVGLGEAKHGPAFGWGDGRHAGLMEDYLLRAVEQTRRRYHVHSERVYLAGIGDGAAMAYRLGMAFADRLAGVVSLNGAMPRVNRPLLDLARVRDLRVFIAHGIANSQIPWALARRDYRVFCAAGMPVTMLSYATTHKLHPHMLRDLNRWVIGHAETAAA